jgi:VIT1/CCC1 family predicted Fe2+/Mn2+ transporter
VLTFTGSIVGEGGLTDTHSVLMAAIGCNLAWGIVDAVLYLMATFAERARGLATLRAVSGHGDRDAAHRLILEALPPVLSRAITPVEVEALRCRLREQAEPRTLLTGGDLAAALAVFLLVFLSTFPIVIPFFVMDEVESALHVSNAIALTILLVTGWSLGRHAGRPGWRAGVGLVALGIVLVAITNALGG